MARSLGVTTPSLAHVTDIEMLVPDDESVVNMQPEAEPELRISEAERPVIDSSKLRVKVAVEFMVDGRAPQLALAGSKSKIVLKLAISDALSPMLLVVPCPSCPTVFNPQHFTWPPVINAQL